MIVGELIRIEAQIAVLKEVAEHYAGHTIDNIIQQLEAIVREYDNGRDE